MDGTGSSLTWVAIAIVVAVAYLFWRGIKRMPTRQSGSHDDVIKGYRFCATLQLRTPLRILERHYTFSEGLNKPPLDCSEADGCWVPELKSWRELGITGLRELPEGTMASDIGQIPESGGEYLGFLKAFRQIVESNEEIQQKCAAILSLGRVNPKFDEYLAKHHNLDPDKLPAFLYKLRIREVIQYDKEESLAYAMRVSEILPEIKKLDTLASRYNTAHEGAGGYGLLAAKKSNNYQEIADYLHKQYLERFVDISSQLIEKARGATAQRKTQKAKINVWLKTKDQIISGAAQFQHDLPGLKQAVDDLTNKIDEEAAGLNK